MSSHTGLPEVICYKIGGAKDEVRKQYTPQEKHPVNIDLAMGGPNSLTLHKLCKTFWLHRRSGGQNREHLQKHNGHEFSSVFRCALFSSFSKEFNEIIVSEYLPSITYPLQPFPCGSFLF
jgi:hypothetical protein